MAKGKDNGGKNNYTPINNPELFEGKKETRTIPEMAQEKRPEAKRDNETFVGMNQRREQDAKQKGEHREKLEKYQIAEKSNVEKNEPEKDR